MIHLMDWASEKSLNVPQTMQGVRHHFAERGANLDVFGHDSVLGARCMFRKTAAEQSETHDMKVVLPANLDMIRQGVD